MGAGLSRLLRIDRNQLAIGLGSLALFWFIYRTAKDKRSGSKSVIIHPTQLEPFQNGPIHINDYPSLPEITAVDRLAPRAHRINPNVQFDEEVSARFRHPDARSSNSVIAIWGPQAAHNSLASNPLRETTFDDLSEVDSVKMVCHHHYALPEAAAERKRTKACQTRGVIRNSVRNEGEQQTNDKDNDIIKLQASKNVEKEEEARNIVDVLKEADSEDMEFLLHSEILSKYSLEPTEQSVSSTGEMTRLPDTRDKPNLHDNYDENLKTKKNYVPSRLPIIESLIKMQPPPPPPVLSLRLSEKSMRNVPPENANLSETSEDSKLDSLVKLPSQQLKPAKRVSYYLDADKDRDEVVEKRVISVKSCMKPHYKVQHPRPSVYSPVSGRNIDETASTISSQHNDFENTFRTEMITAHPAHSDKTSFRTIELFTTTATTSSAISEPTEEINTNAKHKNKGMFAVPSNLPVIESNSSKPPPSQLNFSDERVTPDRNQINEWMKSEILSVPNDDSRLESLGNVSTATASVSSQASPTIKEMSFSFPGDTSATSLLIRSESFQNVQPAKVSSDLDGCFFEGTRYEISNDSWAGSVSDVETFPPLVSSLPSLSTLPVMSSSNKRDEPSCQQRISTENRNDLPTQSLRSVLEPQSLFSLTPITSNLSDASSISKDDDQSVHKLISTELCSDSASESIRDIISSPPLFSLASTKTVLSGALTLSKYKDECFLDGDDTDSRNDSRVESHVNIPTSPPPLFPAMITLSNECLPELLNEPFKETLVHAQAGPSTVSTENTITVTSSMNSEYTDSLFSIPSSNGSSINFKQLELVKEIPTKTSFVPSHPENKLASISSNATKEGHPQQTSSTHISASLKSTAGFVPSDDKVVMTMATSSVMLHQRLSGSPKHEVDLFTSDVESLGEQVPPIKSFYFRDPTKSHDIKKRPATVPEDLHNVLGCDIFPEVEPTKTKEVTEPKVEAMMGHRLRSEAQRRSKSLTRSRAVNFLDPVHTGKITPLAKMSKETVMKEKSRNRPKRIIIESQNDQPSTSKRKMWGI